MRAQPHWPRTLHEWLSGLAVSLPLALLLLATYGTETGIKAPAASVAVALSIPWIVPATIVLAVVSSPIYMWLHTQGPAPAVLDWLGCVVLVAAVIGCHLNTAFLAAWLGGRTQDAPEIGLRDFLFRNESNK